MGRPGDDEKIVRVYVLDDHEIVRRGLREVFASQPGMEVVGDSGSAQEARRRIPAMHPDVAVLDGRLHDGNGIEVCRYVRGIDPSINALILSSYSDPRARAAAREAGAAAYLPKEVTGDDLVRIVEQVARGRTFWTPKRAAQLPAAAAPAPRRPVDDLTDQERRVLGYLAQGYTNKQIATAMHLAEATVKNYVSSMLAKLGMERRTQAAVYGARIGARPSAPGQWPGR